MANGRFVFRHLSKYGYDKLEEVLTEVKPYDMKVLARNNNMRNDGKYTHVIENPVPPVQLIAGEMGTRIEEYGAAEPFPPAAEEKQKEAETLEAEPPAETEEPPTPEEETPEEDVQV